MVGYKKLTHWKLFLPALIIIVLVLAVFATLPSATLEEQSERSEEPILEVFVFPESPATYEETTITIRVANARGLSGPEIVDETRGIKRLILWSHSVDTWEGTRTLVQLLGPKTGLEQSNELKISVTVKDSLGREKSVRKTILLAP